MARATIGMLNIARIEFWIQISNFETNNSNDNDLRCGNCLFLKPVAAVVVIMAVTIDWSVMIVVVLIDHIGRWHRDSLTKNKWPSTNDQSMIDQFTKPNQTINLFDMMVYMVRKMFYYQKVRFISIQWYHKTIRGHRPEQQQVELQGIWIKRINEWWWLTGGEMSTSNATKTEVYSVVCMCVYWIWIWRFSVFSMWWWAPIRIKPNERT